MYGKIKNQLSKELLDIESKGLFKKERVKAILRKDDTLVHLCEEHGSLLALVQPKKIKKKLGTVLRNN